MRGTTMNALTVTFGRVTGDEALKEVAVSLNREVVGHLYKEYEMRGYAGTESLEEAFNGLTCHMDGESLSAWKRNSRNCYRKSTRLRSAELPS